VLGDFNLHLAHDQHSGGTSDCPYPGHLTAWADNLGLQHVAISWQNIKNMLTAKSPWYSRL